MACMWSNARGTVQRCRVGVCPALRPCAACSSGGQTTTTCIHNLRRCPPVSGAALLSLLHTTSQPVDVKEYPRCERQAFASGKLSGPASQFAMP